MDNLIEDKDDKDDRKWIEKFLTLMPENVYILITSRHKNVLLNSSQTLHRKALALELNYFTKEQAKAFFNQNINPERRSLDQNLLDPILLRTFLHRLNFLS